VETQSIAIGVGLFVLGLLIGRLTSPKEKTTTVYQPVSPGGRREITEADPEIEAAITAGHKIDAIRLFREKYNVGLKESKDAVDAIEARLNNR
jgi:ribosomal protein L7/L12